MTPVPENRFPSLFMPCLVSVRERIKMLEDLERDRRNSNPLPGQNPPGHRPFNPYVPPINQVPFGHSHGPMPEQNYPYGPLQSTPGWFRYEPGFNLTNWNEVHSGSTNPVIPWPSLMNVNFPPSLHLTTVIKNLFPNGNVEESNFASRVWFHELVAVDPSRGCFSMKIVNGEGTTASFDIKLLDATGIVQEPSETERVSFDRLAGELTRLCRPHDGSGYLVAVIGNFGEIRSIETRSKTEFSVIEP